MDHIVGLAILVAGGIVDANDGEVARLRLEMSKAGAWLDAIGDDMARLALVAGIGVHVSHLHPDWHALPITGAALAMTVASLVLIYWYCIFVIHSSNNRWRWSTCPRSVSCCCRWARWSRWRWSSPRT
jgi:phosphatidylglycerophosphate synthase